MFNRFIKRLFLFCLFLAVFFLENSPKQVLAQVVSGESDSQIADESKLYTLMPMFLPNAPGNVNYGDLLTAMTIDQGYEAHCAGTQWIIEKNLWGEIDKFFSSSVPPIESFYSGLNPSIFSSTDSYIVDFTKARIPMLRGMESKDSTLKNSSFEGMFGANYQTIEKAYMLNATGVGQNLLTSYQQCLAKSQNLVSIDRICSEVKGDCSLNKKYSLQTDEGKISYHSLEILEWFSEIRPKLKGSALYEQVCADITGGGSFDADVYNETHSDPPKVSQAVIDRTGKAVDLLPIDLDSLYRLAFLVLAPTQDKKDNDKFHFLQSNPQANEAAHAPIFIAFKIPDFGANKSKYANNIDSLELTKMSIQPKEQNDVDIAGQNARRSLNYELAKGAPYLDNPVIKCPGNYPQCARKDDNALLNILVDLINGMNLGCQNTTLRIVEDTTIESIFNQEDLNWEKAGDLFTPANQDIKKNQYNSPTNEKLANALTASGINSFDWQITIDKNPPDLGNPVVVNAYLVLPVGENIKDVNKSLAIFWNEQEFFDLVKSNVIEDMENKAGVIPKYYTIKGADIQFSAADSISPLDEYIEELVQDEDGSWYTQRIPKNYEFGVSLEESKKDVPLYPDFGLGFMIRKIQQTLRTTYDRTYDYISSCQRVEDMFLGRCKGSPEGEKATSFCSGEAFKNIKNLPSASGIPQFARDFFTASIAPKLTGDLIEAYSYAEEQTGIPCEVVAGIHFTEGGNNSNQSVFDGGALHGSLKDDAADAMKHLISKWPTAFDKDNIEYQDLVIAIAAYNGLGNQNCGKETRWLNGGKCPPAFTSEDHPHPLGYIDEKHSDMDLIFCLDYVEFNCSANPTFFTLTALRNELNQKQKIWDFSNETKEGLITKAKEYCFANSGVCQELSSGGKYPRYERPGSITTAILMNEAGVQ